MSQRSLFNHAPGNIFYEAIRPFSHSFTKSKCYVIWQSGKHFISATEMGYGMLKTAAKPVGPILVNILRFIFSYGTIRPEKPSPPTKGSIGDSVSTVESSWRAELLEKILGWGFAGLLGLIMLIVSGVAVFFLFRWLFSRTPISKRRQSSWYLILFGVERLRIFLLSCWRGIVYRVKGYKGAVQLYTALLSWGRYSGLPHNLTETPIEYGLRLKNRFPSLKREIELIIEAFDQEVYGEIVLNEQQLAMAQFALRRLRNPLHWPLRLKTRFLQRAHLSEAIQYRTLDRNLIS